MSGDRQTTFVRVTVMVEVEHGSALTEEQIMREADSCVGRNQSWTGHRETWCHVRQDVTRQVEIVG